MGTRNRCSCGRTMSKYAHECNTCAAERRAVRRAAALAVLETGRCPKCGSALRRNLSLTGWWTCEQRGAEGFRARPNDPHCSFDLVVEEP